MMLKTMTFTDAAFAEIVRTVGSERAESGGILLGSRADFVVRKYAHDPTGSRYGSGYDPDVDFLNEVLTRERQRGLNFLGFVHSHPRGVNRLSGDWGNGIGDLGYIERIFNAMPSLHTFLVPIAFSMDDGQDFALIPYVAERNKVGDYYEAPDGITIVAPSDRDTGRRPNPKPAAIPALTRAFRRKNKLSRSIMEGPA